MKKKTVSPSRQTQVPGTEGKASKRLREIHERLAIAAHEKVELEAEIKELNREALAMMTDETVESIATQVEVGDRYKTYVTFLQTQHKLKSKFLKEKKPKKGKDDGQDETPQEDDAA